MEYALNLFPGEVYKISKNIISETILSETAITNQTALPNQTQN